MIATSDAYKVLPSYANVTDKDPQIMIDEVQELREISERYGVPFVVKSGFRSTKLLGWRSYTPLDKKNLNLIKEGIIPKGTLSEEISGFKLPYRVVSSD